MDCPNASIQYYNVGKSSMMDWNVLTDILTDGSAGKNM